MFTKVFFTGATGILTSPKCNYLFLTRPGYIGGSVLNRLLDHPQREKYEITVLLRSSEKAKAFESLGLKVTTGSMTDLEFLEQTVARYDIIFQTVAHRFAFSKSRLLI